MLKLRLLAPVLCQTHHIPLTFFSIRPLATKVKKPKTTGSEMKFLHEEKFRYVDNSACVRVISDILVKIQSADLHEYPNGDVIIAQLHGGPEKNCPATMELNVSDNEKCVEVKVKKINQNDTDFCCVLAVPIKASLDIQSESSATVSKLFGDNLRIKAQKYISISDVKADTIEIESVEGNIISHGLLLGRKTSIEAKENGHIILDKLQGDYLNCKANTGNISTNSCYVECSKFETNDGTLDLQNVHKSTEVYVHRDGNLKMTGVHGNIKVNFNGNSMELQLSELVGDNYVKSNNAKTSVINISDTIESNTTIEAQLQNSDAIITLDTNLEHLMVGLHENKRQFNWPLQKKHPNKLQIYINDSLKLGKSSWMEMLKLRMNQNPENGASGEV